MKKIIIFLCIFILSSTSALATSDDEILVGLCQTLQPIGKSDKQVVCTKKGNQIVCQEKYDPQVLKSCRKMFEQMGLLKPGESPRVLLYGK